MAVEISVTEKADLEGYTLIEGFPGIGLIGTIAVGYLAERKGSKLIGYVVSSEFPPMASIHKGKPLFPARIYVCPDMKVCLLFSEFVVPSSSVYEIADEILKFAKANKIRRIISLAGINVPAEKADEGKPKLYAIASNDAITKEVAKFNADLITEGVTTGVSGVLLAKCHQANFPAMSLLIETGAQYPDPRSAAHLLEKLSKIMSIEIDTKALIEESKQIEDKMKKYMQQIQAGKSEYQKAEESPMYG